jgi:DNA-binding NarL/FixJ family response regulator
LSPHGRNPRKKSIEVVVVCRPQLLRIGLEGVLGGDPGLKVSSFEAMPERDPIADVAVVCDRGIGNLAAECERALDAAARNVAIVLSRPTPEVMLDCLAAGAGGFVAEHDDPAELAHAVRALMRGDYHMAAGPLAMLLDWHRMQRRSQGERARARDRDLLGLLASGRTTEEIAERLGIAPKTVRNRTSLLYRKLGVRSRTQAAIAAEERGLLD